MADIKYYLREKEKREQMQTDYKEKIARHKLTALYRILLLIAVLIALVVILVVRHKQYVYTDYDIIASVERESIYGTTDVRLGNSILSYSKDGAHCTDALGNVSWNQTFEIQDIKLALSGNTVAIGDYNGRSIYIANSGKLLGQITTAMPIRSIAISEAGYVAAVLADTDITWINIYNFEGERLYEGKTHMDDAGYPVAVSLSPSGELFCVSYVYVDAGVLKSDVAFYNLGAVGDNKEDNIVSGWTFTDMLVPFVQFMNDHTAFAVGDSRLEIYTGSHIPTPQAGHLLNSEVQSIFYSERYIGLVFLAENGDQRYRFDVYDINDIASTEPKRFYFDLNYTDIFFGKDNFVIYNETECLIMNINGIEKFNGRFAKSVRLMLPAGNGYKYLLVTEDSIDTIQLK